MSNRTLTRAEESAALNLELGRRMPELVEQLIGDSPDSRHGDGWRWGQRGSLVVQVKGPKQGGWYDHEAKCGGSPIDLIEFTTGLDTKGAHDLARQFTGMGIGQKLSLPPPDPERKARLERQEQENRQERVQKARDLWGDTTRINGTVAERYLTERRGIQPRDGEWPADVRYHHQSRSLILAARNDAGELTAVHRVHLTKDGEKAPPTQYQPTKQSTGILVADSFIRLPGASRGGPLAVTEGPENALTLWAAGYEVRAKSSVWRSILDGHVPTDRPIIVSRDDDPKGSKADIAVEQAVEHLRSHGAQVAVATPWAERREDKSDMNDVARDQGLDAVRERVEGAGRELPRREDDPVRQMVDDIHRKIQERSPETRDLTKHAALVYTIFSERMQRDMPALSEEGHERLREALLVEIREMDKRGEIRLTGKQQTLLIPPDAERVRELLARDWVAEMGQRLEGAHTQREINMIENDPNVARARGRLDVGYPELAAELASKVSEERQRVRDEQQHDRDEKMPERGRTR